MIGRTRVTCTADDLITSSCGFWQLPVNNRSHFLTLRLVSRRNLQRRLLLCLLCNLCRAWSPRRLLFNMDPLTSFPLPSFVTDEANDWPPLHWDQEDALQSSSPSDDFAHEALPTVLHSSAAKAKARGLDSVQHGLCHCFYNRRCLTTQAC